MSTVGTTGQVIDPEGVNHPAHYNNHPSGLEVKEVTNWLPFNLGNVFKYSVRFGEKGEPQKDVKKALWYARESEETGEALRVRPASRDGIRLRAAMDQFIKYEKRPHVRNVLSALYNTVFYHPSVSDPLIEAVTKLVQSQGATP
jgi:hypothetical protein